MTVEAALAKLSFVMGKEALTREDRKMVSFTDVTFRSMPSENKSKRAFHYVRTTGL